MDHSEESAGLRISGNDHALKGAIDQFVVGGKGIVFGLAARLVAGQTAWFNDEIVDGFIARLDFLGEEGRGFWDLEFGEIEDSVVAPDKKTYDTGDEDKISVEHSYERS